MRRPFNTYNVEIRLSGEGDFSLSTGGGGSVAGEVEGAAAGPPR